MHFIKQWRARKHHGEPFLHKSLVQIILMETLNCQVVCVIWKTGRNLLISVLSISDTHMRAQTLSTSSEWLEQTSVSASCSIKSALLQPQVLPHSFKQQISIMLRESENTQSTHWSHVLHLVVKPHSPNIQVKASWEWKATFLDWLIKNNRWPRLQRWFFKSESMRKATANENVGRLHASKCSFHISPAGRKQELEWSTVQCKTRVNKCWIFMLI